MRTHAWQRTVGALLFLPIIIYTVISYPLILLLLSVIVYTIIALTVTVGYHRYYSHASFKCNKFWQILFGFIGTSSLNSSPLEWASVHLAHHRYSDTDKDPYDSTWKQFIKFKDRTNITSPKSLLVLLKDPVHRNFVRYSFGIALAVASLITLALGVKYFIILYAVPVTGYLFTSYLHNILAHIGGEPRNLWFLEFIVPMCGEWLHKLHHEKPKLNDFNISSKYFDLGGYFIRGIKLD